MTKQHFSDTDRTFYSDGFKLGLSMVENGMTKETLFQATRSMYNAIDDLINSLLSYAKRQGVNIDCKKGCEWCCHQAIFAISHEVHFLTDYMADYFSGDQIKTVLQKAKDKNDQVKKLGTEDILNVKSPCPLLNDGKCSVYEARPMACRIYLSQNLSSCIEFYKHPENKNKFPALLDFPLRAGRMMNEGFKAALKSQNLNSTEFRIEQGMIIASTSTSLADNQLKDLPLYL